MFVECPGTERRSRCLLNVVAGENSPQLTGEIMALAVDRVTELPSFGDQSSRKKVVYTKNHSFSRCFGVTGAMLDDDLFESHSVVKRVGEWKTRWPLFKGEWSDFGHLSKAAIQARLAIDAVSAMWLGDPNSRDSVATFLYETTRSRNNDENNLVFQMMGVALFGPLRDDPVSSFAVSPKFFSEKVSPLTLRVSLLLSTFGKWTHAAEF